MSLRPPTYFKFTAFDAKNSPTEFRIEDFPPDRIEDGVKFMMEHFVNDEPIFRSRNLTSDPIAVEEGAQLWRESLEQNCSIVCFKKDSTEIIAMNILTIESEDDDAHEIDGEKVRKLINSRGVQLIFFSVSIEGFAGHFGPSQRPPTEIQHF